LIPFTTSPGGEGLCPSSTSPFGREIACLQKRRLMLLLRIEAAANEIARIDKMRTYLRGNHVEIQHDGAATESPTEGT
jgi:hypothetical protein